jgi:hypothetical protein
MVIGETSPRLANITITHEIPQGFKIKKRVDNSDWKGISLDQVEFEEKQILFEMS